eukprot:TRINITY_DN8378_c0_g5_i5.p1 TRINITY_DN8378_c0_g5~~TRINITY_DN8378_c0_g5_i5.p1  ORF type:complete len:222 (+),score=12.65 TRINITY_DN8378_c0_g5_i5:225-890(+)
MKVTLEIPPGQLLELDWNFTESYTDTGARNYIKITPEIKRSLKGRIETFFVTFLDRTLVRDYYNNSLSTAIVSGPAARNIAILPAFEDTGTAFNAVNYIALILSLLLSMKSNAAFWAFLGTIQIISYVPLLHCVVPQNLKFFIKEYFSITKPSIPFDQLPEFIPDPLVLIKKNFEIAPENIKIIEARYTSICFLYNFGYQLLTWAAVILLYILLRVLSKSS